jgi:hypothetical protein
MDLAARHLLERAEVGTWRGWSGQHRFIDLSVEIATKPIGSSVRFR